MIEDLEANLTGKPIDASNTDNSAVSEEENSDESITELAKTSKDMEIYIKEEHKIEAYQNRMKIDIENINTIEKRHKNDTKRWRTIYKVIQQELFDETEIFPDIILKHFKNNANKAHNIPIDAKDNIN